jgi:hypothetical protein
MIIQGESGNKDRFLTIMFAILVHAGPLLESVANPMQNRVY